MKKCPYCAEEIQDEAIKCRYCGEFLDGMRPPPVPAGKPVLPWYFRPVVIVIAIFSVGPLALPMIWWHPKLKTPWKIGITVAVTVLTWLTCVATAAALKSLNEQLRMLESI